MAENFKVLLDEMIENKVLEPEAPNRLKALFNLLPFSSSLLNVVDKTGLATSNLVAVNAKSMQRAFSSLKSANVLQWLGVGLSALDLVFVPITAALYFDKHDKGYFALTKTAKFVYSAAALSLLTLSVFFPPVAIATAVVGVAGAGVSLINHFYKKIRVSKQLDSVTNKLEIIDQKLENISKQAATLANSPNPEKIEELYKKFKMLQNDKQEMLNHQQSLLIQNKKLTQKRGRFDKFFGFAASVIGLAGVVTAIFIPPVGLGILAGVGASAATYMSLRFLYELTHRNKPENENATNKNETSDSVEDHVESNSVESRLTIEKNHTDVSDTTANISRLMCPDNPKGAIKAQLQNDHEINVKQGKALKMIHTIQNPPNKQVMQTVSIELMSAIGRHIQEGTYTKEDIKDFFHGLSEFDEIRPKLREVVNDIAKGDIEISDDQLRLIQQIPKASKAMSEYHKKFDETTKQEILSEVDDYLNTETQRANI